MVAIDSLYAVTMKVCLASRSLFGLKYIYRDAAA